MDSSVLASRASFLKSLKRNSLLIVLIAGFANPALALDWSIKDLGILPGALHSTGNGLNDSGQVTGNMNYGTHDDNGIPRMDQLVYLSGPNGGPLHLIDTSGVVPGVTVYSANDVNNSGQVVGTYLLGSSTDVAWSTETDGGAIRNTVHFSRGRDINNSGIGLYQGTFGGIYVVAPDGTPNKIVLDGEPSIAAGINDSGRVALTKSTFDPDTGEFSETGAVWSESEGFRSIFFNGARTELHDINSSGQVLGTLPSFISPLFVVDPDDTVHTLNITLKGVHVGSDPFKLNDKGQVIGISKNGNTSFSFLTSIGTEEIINLSMEEDVLAAGWSNITVSDINNLGQITGTGVIDGKTRAFLLTPVPEPESYAMMLAGLSMLGFLRRRKQAELVDAGGTT